ncbi:IclR family transcriptional regulator [Natronorubrum sp. FCH18a]|uniref:IclR family transcriptional regulator n=1 Tax=Natronorubrum sp. FCH18a TaxID=3447018 RepID=UPI003F5100B2
MTGTGPTRRIKTADNVFDIFDTIQEENGATIGEIATKLGLANSTVSDYLATLEAREYVVREGNEFRLSFKFLDYGIHVKNKDRLAQTATPILEQKAVETGEVVYLIVEEHGRAIFLDKSVGERATETTGRVGLRANLHYLAGGKVILAHMDRTRVDQIIQNHGLPKRTENTITNPEELYDELDEIRERGTAYNMGEEIEGLRAVAAPVIHGDEILGGISIAVPSTRFENSEYKETLLTAVREAANEVELRLRYE